MGYGGAIGSMNLILKNNRNLLPKREKFKRTYGKYSNGEKPEYDFPKAQAHVLKRIRERLIEERKQRDRKRIIVFSFIMVILISVLISYLI